MRVRVSDVSPAGPGANTSTLSPAFAECGQTYAPCIAGHRSEVSVTQSGGAESFELVDDDAVAVLPRHLVARIALEIERAERHVGRVDRQDPTDQRLAEAEDDLDRLQRLDAADDAGQHAEYAGLGARGSQLGRRRFGDHVAVRRPVPRVEHRDHALE